MAVTFTPLNSDPLTIGGTAATGPFPKYSISTEQITTGDGTVIDLLYNVTVTGQVLSSGDITTAGLRQSNLQAKIIERLGFTEHSFPKGLLEIVPYGGLSNTISFNDASLVSIDLPEQDDGSSGVQYQDYTFTFQARLRSSQKTGSEFFLASATETWEITENDGDYAFTGNDVSTTPQKTYTITHVVDATGANKITSSYEKSAWDEAKSWCESRLVNSPASVITADAAGNSEFTDFKAERDLQLNTSTSTYYNHNRVANSDIAGGSYSVTETWFASESAATHDIEVSMEESQDGDTTVTVSGTIKGLSTSTHSSQESNKLTQAKSVLSTCLGKCFTLANALYTNSGPAGTLSTVERTKSIGENNVTGTVTYSISYNDAAVTIPNAISETIAVTDDNEDRTNKVIAVIGVIGKATGPVIQDMGTTTERKRSLSVDAVMEKAHRTTKPDVSSIITTYQPSGGYQQAKSESWTASNGNYTLSVEWTY